MKNLIITLFIVLCEATYSQDTFSIVAMDTITGEIGSAGASCIDDSQIEGGAIIISDVLPGRGAIHTQSYWNATNQQNAHNRMVEGLSPQEIIDWLTTHDAQGNPAVRQYGVVDFDTNGHARSAAFTGASCMDYKNHITSPNYSIQGNILLGQQILDSIEARFLNAEGTFPERMMAALQGANVVGADSRCTMNGTSSLSAFIRIARPQDTTGTFYCDLNVPSLPEGMEPIDSLQTLFDAWLETIVGYEENEGYGEFAIYPNPADDYIKIVSGRRSAAGGRQSLAGKANTVIVKISDMFGNLFIQERVNGRDDFNEAIDLGGLDQGMYLIAIYHVNHLIFRSKFTKINSR